MYSYQLPNTSASWDWHLTKPAFPWMGRSKIRPMTVVKAILSPEPSDGFASTLPVEIRETAWFGPVKTVFWIVASIAIALFLATICS